MSEKKKKGFATLSSEQRSAIATLGGKAAHAAGTAHKFTSEEARIAGSKGGKMAHAKKREETTAQFKEDTEIAQHEADVRGSADHGTVH